MMISAELRLRARNALKGNWQEALLVMFLASLPSLISQTVTILQGNTFMDVLVYNLQNSSADVFANPNFLFELAQVQAGSGYLLRNVLSVLSWLISPFLTLGMLNYLLQRLRGAETSVSMVLSRKGCFFKGLGLQIMIALKTVLWMLPGLALSVAGVLLSATMSSATIPLLLVFAGYVVAMVFTVRASFSYMMAFTAMAEQPDLGVMAAIGASKTMMAGRRMQLFFLMLSFIGWAIVLMLVDALFSSMGAAVIGSTVYMLLQLVLQVYMQTSECAFYDACRNPSNTTYAPWEEQHE